MNEAQKVERVREIMSRRFEKVADVDAAEPEVVEIEASQISTGQALEMLAMVRSALQASKKDAEAVGTRHEHATRPLLLVLWRNPSHL